jgi:hypothetical protein
MKDLYEFFVEENSNDASDIKRIVACLDAEKGEYKINYFKPTEHVNEIPILKLKVTFSTGETLEYNRENFFRAIVNVVKSGVKLPK